jgi:hypothetical protein
LSIKCVTWPLIAFVCATFLSLPSGAQQTPSPSNPAPPAPQTETSAKPDASGQDNNPETKQQDGPPAPSPQLPLDKDKDNEAQGTSGVNAPKRETGHITGTVIDVKNDPVPGATVVLEGPVLGESSKVVSNDNGFFEFNDLDPGSYNVTISASGFANWTSRAIVLQPGQYLILPGSKLQIAKALTTVTVSNTTQEKIAAEQVKIEEQQRVFGIVPNFYVAYDRNTVPLTTKLKFKLALRISIDPFTIAGIGMLAGINQAAHVPNYVEGVKGYAERYGASAADGLSDIMIGGAILPSLLHQDPRYFYQGTGTNKSRALHALSSAFICKGDNGKMQPNYSTIGGDLASSALSNAYYPASNRGAGLVLDNFIMFTGERMFSNLLQEFVLGKFTSRGRTAGGASRSPVCNLIGDPARPCGRATSLGRRPSLPNETEAHGERQAYRVVVAQTLLLCDRWQFENFVGICWAASMGSAS